VGAEFAELVGALHRTTRTYQRLDRAAEPLRGGHHLVGNLPQRAVALLQDCQRGRHSTFASSRSKRTSSGTAPTPSPTILPSFRSGGGMSATTSMVPAP